MSFATCQPLMNASPSAFKQPKALQERQAGVGVGGTGKGVGAGTCFFIKNLMENCQLYTHSLCSQDSAAPVLSTSDQESPF